MRLLAPLVALGLVLLGAPAPASAAACSGVTVVVDFGSLGGGVRTGCAGGDPASGLAALGAAGFAFDLASRQPGFVCRINGTPASDPCVNTAPTSAYWSYWHGSGGGWSYSSAGAAGHDPTPGSVEGWAFGAGGQPGIAPPAPEPQPQPQPQPQPPPPVQPAPNQPGAPQPTTQPGTPQTQPATTTGEPTPTTVAPTTTGSEQPSSGTPTPPSTTASVVPTAQTRDDDTGPPVGLLVGLVVIAALGGAGFWIARRRSAGSDT